MIEQDLGPRPELHWLPVGRLGSNRIYQRSIETSRGQANINRIAAGFKWSLFGAVTVATAAVEGEYAIIDGQHRVEAARRVGLDTVPCLLVDVRDVTEQAKLFVASNKNRVALTPLGIFNAMLSASDPVSISVRSACSAAGVEILRYPVQAKNIKAGQTMAISTIRSIHRRHGPEKLTEILRVLVKHWATPGSIRADRLRAISMLCSLHEIERVDQAILELTPDAVDLAADCHQEHGRTRHEAMHNLISEHLAGSSASVLNEPRELLTRSVRRRCERCHKLFETKDVGQTTCGQEICK